MQYQLNSTHLTNIFTVGRLRDQALPSSYRGYAWFMSKNTILSKGYMSQIVQGSIWPYFFTKILPKDVKKSQSLVSDNGGSGNMNWNESNLFNHIIFRVFNSIPMGWLYLLLYKEGPMIAWRVPTPHRVQGSVIIQSAKTSKGNTEML